MTENFQKINTTVIDMAVSPDSKMFEEGIRIASEYILKGDIVAFPTETVYGLGGSAFMEEAVNKIYIAKKRPPEKPLNILLACREDMFSVAENVPDEAWTLAEMFWPGPLTIILSKRKCVPDIVTRFKKTVGLRVPDHPIPLRLIEKTGPLACPSANISGNKPPVSCREVMRDLKGRIPLILDGGKSPIGVASTIIDMTKPVPKILRKGGVKIKEIEKYIGDVSEE